MQSIGKKHIVHLVYRFDVGGLERIVCNTINALDHDHYRHTIVALTEIGDFVSEVQPEVAIYALDKKPGGNLPYFRQFYRLLKDLRPDVVHSYNLATIEFQWVSWFAKVPVRIHAEHGRDTYDPEGKVRKYQWVRRLCQPAIDITVPVSKDLEQWLLNIVQLEPEKVKLIHNGVDTEQFQTDYKAPGEEFIFGHVARLQGIKNQQMLLASFAQSCEREEGFAAKARLHIVGDGPDRTMLEELVANTPLLKDRVVFLGSRNDVIELYKTFDVFVMSSIAEGIPMTLLESMSMGVPHLVTNVGGIGEVIIPDKTGLAVAEGDGNALCEGMLTLQRLPAETMVEFSKQSRKRILEQFSQTVMLDNYEQLYQMNTTIRR